MGVVVLCRHVAQRIECLRDVHTHSEYYKGAVAHARGCVLTFACSMHVAQVWGRDYN